MMFLFVQMGADKQDLPSVHTLQYVYAYVTERYRTKRDRRWTYDSL